MIQRLVEDIVSVTESLVNQEAPFVINARAERHNGDAQSQKGGSLEKQLGSANQDNKTEHHGTCAFTCRYLLLNIGRLLTNCAVLSQTPSNARWSASIFRTGVERV